MHRLTIISPGAEAYAQQLRRAALPGLVVNAFQEPSAAQEAVSQTEILMGLPAFLAEVVNDAPGLKWAQSTSAGVEEVCAAGLRRDYILTNARDIFGPIMSEYVFGYIMTLERNILALHQHQQQREWVRWDHYPYRRLSDLTLGVIGVGSIGQHIAATGKHFGMRVLGMKRSAEPVDCVDEIYTLDQLGAFLPQVDYLVMVLPSTEQTYHFVNADFLALMKEDAVLLNVGRGSTVDEVALCNALQQNRIKHAVLDVFEEEPLVQSSPFWELPNALITPHISALSFPEHVSGIFVRNYRRYIQGESLEYVVDFEQGY